MKYFVIKCANDHYFDRNKEIIITDNNIIVNFNIRLDLHYHLSEIGDNLGIAVVC